MLLDSIVNLSAALYVSFVSAQGLTVAAALLIGGVMVERMYRDTAARLTNRPLSLVLLIAVALVGCGESSDGTELVAIPTASQDLTAYAVCEDWKADDPAWVAFCAALRAAAQALLEHEDPLCAEYAQAMLDADALDRLRWTSGTPSHPQEVCYTSCFGEDCTTYCYDAAFTAMPESAIPHLVEHEGCHHEDPQGCTDAQVSNRYSPTGQSPAVGSGAYEANRCIGSDLQPWWEDPS